MKTIILTCLLCVVILTGQAQDTLHMFDGSVREGTVVEVTARHIRYIPANAAHDRVYTILLQAVEKIIYADGTVNYLHPSRSPKPPPEWFQSGKEEWAEQFAAAKNMASLSLISILYRGSISMAYERFFKSGDMGIKIPFSVGFTYSEYGFFEGRVLFSSGLAINSYTRRQNNLTTFMGFAVFAGAHEYYPDFPISFDITASAKFFGAEVYYGFRMPLSKRMGVSGQAGIGIGKTEEYNVYSMRLPIDVSLLLRI